MNKNWLAIIGCASALSACSSGVFSAQTIAEVFTKYPGNHAIINNAAVPMNVPLGAGDSIAFIVNPGTFSVNSLSIPRGVEAFTTSAAANARVLGSQLGFTLHLTPAAQTALTTAVNSACTNDGNGGCVGSTATRALAYTKAGSSVNVVTGTFALKIARVNAAQGGAGASFQSANQVTLTTFAAGGVAPVTDGDVVFLMDLNSAKILANPIALPVAP